MLATFGQTRYYYSARFDLVAAYPKCWAHWIWCTAAVGTRNGEYHVLWNSLSIQEITISRYVHIWQCSMGFICRFVMFCWIIQGELCFCKVQMLSLMDLAISHLPIFLAWIGSIRSNLGFLSKMIAFDKQNDFLTFWKQVFNAWNSDWHAPFSTPSVCTITHFPYKLI